MVHSSGLRWLALALVGGTAVGVFYMLRARKLREDRLTREIKKKKKKRGSINLGAVFGMDVGGTLTKIVYFERALDGPGSSAAVSSADLSAMAKLGASPGVGGGLAESTLNPSPLGKKTNSHGSLSQLDNPDHKAALQELYGYMDTTLARSRSGEKGPINILQQDVGLTFYSSVLGGKMNFLNFETRNMVTAINMLASQNAITENIKTIGCTGGGAHKYASDVEDQLDIHFEQQDELDCLVCGMHFALTHIENECYTYRSPVVDQSNRREVKEYTQRVQMPYNSIISKSPFPYLVVNIGSGVSILKISAPGKYERVSGSSVGGGTYWGLCRLLVPSKETYQEVLNFAETGDPSRVDMLVKDIYGGSYDAMNLSGSMVASSFGKLVMKEYPRDGMKEEDLAIALLMMITNNIGQVAYLNAQLHNCSKIFFVGSFLRRNTISCRRLAFAIDFWSKGAMEALFLVHEGYFGSIGTFLKTSFGADDLAERLFESEGL